jgi:hypothetical protein
MNNEIFYVVFRELSKEIKKLNDEDIAKILSGQAKFRLQVIEKTEKQSQTTKSNVEIRARAIAVELNSMTSNEEGMELLKERCKRKADLHKLAQHLDIPFRKRDTILQLIEKIIESTIAYRTRAAAIQKQK